MAPAPGAIGHVNQIAGVNVGVHRGALVGGGLTIKQ